MNISDKNALTSSIIARTERIRHSHPALMSLHTWLTQDACRDSGYPIFSDRLIEIDHLVTSFDQGEPGTDMRAHEILQSLIHDATLYRFMRA